MKSAKKYDRDATMLSLVVCAMAGEKTGGLSGPGPSTDGNARAKLPVKPWASALVLAATKVSEPIENGAAKVKSGPKTNGMPIFIAVRPNPTCASAGINSSNDMVTRIMAYATTPFDIGEPLYPQYHFLLTFINITNILSYESMCHGRRPVSG